MWIEGSDVGRVLAIGVGATATMDLWNFALKRIFEIPSLNYCLLGRWISHMPSGVFRHSSIANSSPKQFECGIGWVAHYSIGIGLALLFILIVSPAWMLNATLLPALFFGIATVAFPFLIMQPALGFGIASSRAPNPIRARLKSVGTHTVFGIGLYLFEVGLNQAL